MCRLHPPGEKSGNAYIFSNTLLTVTPYPPYHAQIDGKIISFPMSNNSQISHPTTFKLSRKAHALAPKKLDLERNWGRGFPQGNGGS